MDDTCRTVTVFKNRRDLDGVKCSRCDGPVLAMPFKQKSHKPSERALYVRRSILWENKEHCFDLTPEQVDTVLSLGDDFQKTKERHRTI